jgi:hypothetical protein
MLRHFALWLALAAAIIFAGSGKALAQFSRSESIDLSSSSYGSGSGSFEHNPISRQFTFSGSFFGYSGYGSSSYARNNDNSIFGADGLYLTTDDGLRIRSGSIAQNLVTSAQPNDFADLDEDSNTTELLPYDAAGADYPSIPYNAGAYQTGAP